MSKLTKEQVELLTGAVEDISEMSLDEMFATSGGAGAYGSGPYGGTYGHR